LNFLIPQASLVAVESRRTGLSVLITVGIMLGLGVVAAVHRRQIPPPAAETTHQIAPTGSVSAISLTPDDFPANPLDPPPKAEWEVLPSCRLLPNKTNAAHYFHVTRGPAPARAHQSDLGGDPFVFQLYGVEAPEATTASDDEVAEQSRYFGLAEHLDEEESAERLGELGQQAWAAVAHLLSRPFAVFTRWERRPDSHYFYAFVYLKDDDGTRRFLQDWLVEHGYAIITRPSLGRLPNGQKGEQFLEDLEVLQHSAQQRKSGAWGLLSERK
jgi:endonuclease YncB( thermonuclease family)